MYARSISFACHSSFFMLAAADVYVSNATIYKMITHNTHIA